jgi:ABC-type transport system involved in multi-copper enzyme maturation permease subunit
MFAALIFDTDPLQYQDIPSGLLTWIQVFGGFAAFLVLLWLAVGLPRMRGSDRAALPRWLVNLFVGSVLLSAGCYTLAAFAGMLDLAAINTRLLQRTGQSLVSLLLFFGGLFALIPFLLPFALESVRMRIRRIYALAKLSFKEAVRRRVLYVLGMFLIFCLFASWFLTSKSEDQVRTYVQVMALLTTILLLFSSVLLASFSIPADIKQQTIHTIVTKPVERFEVVLGRFFGFLALMTLVLVIMTTVSLYLILQGVTPEAAFESLKARVPLRADLRFENTESDRFAVNVGREWDYRSYITAPNPDQKDRAQTARWDFATLDRSLGARDKVRGEYTFDIYRTTTGIEGQDVTCKFRFKTWRYREGNDKIFVSELGASKADPIKHGDLAEKLGYYEITGLPVTDYHTQTFDVPAGLFRNALESDPERLAEIRARAQETGKAPPALLEVRVTCESLTQYVGMNKNDLYFRLDEEGGWEKLQFSLNYFKAAFGLWLRLALLIGVAVVASTYLSGVITLLLTLLLYIGGVCKDSIREVALGINQGGGPVEAMVRISRRELTGPSMRESEATTEQLVSAFDEGFRGMMRVVLHAIPDVDRFDLTKYVAEGFDVSIEQMVLSFLLLAAYLLPWALIGYYLMKSREVANPN